MIGNSADVTEGLVTMGDSDIAADITGHFLFDYLMARASLSRLSVAQAAELNHQCPG
jgi:hypothetical protein